MTLAPSETATWLDSVGETGQGEQGKMLQWAMASQVAPPSRFNPVHSLAPLGRKRHRWGLILLLLALVFTAFAPQFAHEGARWAGKFFSHTFHNIWLIGGILVILWQAWRGKSKVLFTQALAAFGTETAIMQISQKGLYHGFGLMPRPSGTDGGFPSGHTAAHCVLAYLLTERFPKGGPVFYTAAALVGWSRWQDGSHYPYQVVAGAVLGLACAALLAPRFGEVILEPTPVQGREQEGEAERV